MVRKIVRIGNSVGVTLSKKMLRRIGMDGATWASIQLDTKRKQIIIRKRQEDEW